MSRLNDLLQELKEGHTVDVIAGGTSMRGRIEYGQIVTITPVDFHDVQIGDIVFVRWIKGNYLIHLVKEINGDQFLIANNVGKINGWVHGTDIIGKITRVVDP